MYLLSRGATSWNVGVNALEGGGRGSTVKTLKFGKGGVK